MENALLLKRNPGKRRKQTTKAGFFFHRRRTLGVGAERKQQTLREKAQSAAIRFGQSSHLHEQKVEDQKSEAKQ